MIKYTQSEKSRQCMELNIGSCHEILACRFHVSNISCTEQQIL
jgi:hypothetical protein